MAGRALPSHLKPSAAEGGEGGFAPRHHGKTQSHVVSHSLFLQPCEPSAAFYVNLDYGVSEISLRSNVIQLQLHFLGDRGCPQSLIRGSRRNVSVLAVEGKETSTVVAHLFLEVLRAGYQVDLLCNAGCSNGSR